MCNLHLDHSWAWIPLVTLLAVGCDGCKAPGPRVLVCEPIAYYEVLNPEQGAGKAPFSIERLGPQVKDVKFSINHLEFTGENRVTTYWSRGHFYGMTDFIYSPDGGLVRAVEDPDIVRPMKLFSDGKSERVRFGFRSQVCRKPLKRGGVWDCDLTENELFLVADMTCRWELVDPRELE